MLARILVVDHESEVRESLGAALGDIGEVLAIGSSIAARELLTMERFDVIAVEAYLPSLDGHALLRAARALPRPPEVVLMTADASLESVLAALRAGAADYAIKPFDPVDVRVAVLRAVRCRGPRPPRGDSAPAVDRVAPSGLFEEVAGEGVRCYLESLLRRFDGNVHAAAEHAAVDRVCFARICRRYDVELPGHRAA